MQRKLTLPKFVHCGKQRATLPVTHLPKVALTQTQQNNVSDGTQAYEMPEQSEELGSPPPQALAVWDRPLRATVQAKAPRFKPQTRGLILLSQCQ